jgi:hypothetical protein
VRVIARDQDGGQASQEFKFLLQSDVRGDGGVTAPDDAPMHARHFRSFAAQLTEQSYDSPLDRSQGAEPPPRLRRAG